MSFVRETGAEPIPGYHLLEPLGSGGFGEVWKCEAPGGIYKAIKFVYGNLNAVDGESVRAEQERDALNRVKEVRHPFVLSMDRIEEVEGELAIVMELADKSLHDRFIECQTAGLVGIPREDLLRYLRDAAEALDHMIVKHNLQHLDIKPRNLFLVSDRVKVADFGLVKHIARQSGNLSSITPLYAAPETFLGQISEHSDQYSLAIVYQELLTGQRPFNAKNARQLALQHTREEPELRSLPEIERPVVARALSKDPARRYPNCFSFVRALYHARSPAKLVPIKVSPPNGDQSSRTMAETMEDIHFDMMDHENGTNGKAPVETAEENNADRVSQLGITMSMPETGALRPTLIIGIGGFGRRALIELRCRFLDRFGNLGKVPVVRFLYVDPDQDSVRGAMRGAPEIAFTSQDTFPLPLQPVGNYRRRMLDQLTDWLPREKLYAMPRSLQTQGSRALGRLAFADNHLRFMARLRREVQQATHPDAIFQSVSGTELALRDEHPRVYVIAAAGGGSSGLMVDLGYALKRLMHQLRHPQAEVTAFLFCGAPEDPATPRAEQANIYATLTELNHFSDTAIPFVAQYGADGPRTVDNGQPYHQVYLLKLPHRSPETVRDTAAHLGSYLFHELTTPLGIRLDQIRQEAAPANATLFRSFGTHAIWFPRGLLLRQAARRACGRLLEEWQTQGNPTAVAEVDSACASALADPELRFETLCNRMQERAATAFDANLGAALTALLSTLEEQSQQSVAIDDAGNWSRQALVRIQEWVGTGLGSDSDSGWRRSKLSKALTTVSQKLAIEWNEKLAMGAFKLMEHPGGRIAAAETVVTRCMQFCEEAAAAQKPYFEQQVQRTRLAGKQLEQALEACIAGSGGFSFFGSRSRRLLRVFMDHLAAFSRQRLVEEVVSSGIQFFACLHGKLNERLRELASCRQRLRGLQASLEVSGDDALDLDTSPLPGDPALSQSPPPSPESYWNAIRDSHTAQLVLPEGEEDLQEAADHFIQTLNPDQWTLLDTTLQEQVMAGLGGLYQVCMTGADLGRYLAVPLIEAAAFRLGEMLQPTDVAEVEFSAAAAKKSDLRAQIQANWAIAAPLFAGNDAKGQKAFLLLPTSNAGKKFGEEALQALPELELVRVPGQADLMFCREHNYLNAEDLHRVFRSCRQAYDDSAMVPNISPHARFDVLEWAPLDP